MSIALIVTSPKTPLTSSIYLPVATEDFFNGIWQPGIEALGLQWLGLFRAGADIDREYFRDVSVELEKLR